nr:unnamed protein product [Callosobruchus analis]
MKIIPIHEVEEVLLKYNKEENDIEQNFKFRPVKQQAKDNDSTEKDEILSKDDAKRRNKQLLKELETVKANLRSKAIYSPTEIHWKRISENYKADPALTVKTWRCYLPVYV